MSEADGSAAGGAEQQPASVSPLRRPWLILTLGIVVAAAEIIGMQRFQLGAVSIVLLPLVFAFIIGLLINPNLLGFGRWLSSERDGPAAARAVAVAVMPLIALMSVNIGPELGRISEAGIALLLQEFGNLGTMLVAMPVAVLLFGFGREAIGATFSIGREGGIAFIYSRYGGGTPEASGVTAIYICGTFCGTAFFALLAPLIAGFDWLDVRALAMACGTGSASMTAACTTALAAVEPEQAELIAALGAASTLMTGLTGLFLTIFVTMPLIERYYALLDGIRRRRRDR